jgi:hypothetical protein
MPNDLSLQERAEVIETCSQWAWCIDERRWEDLASLFADQCEVDYTELFGGEPMVVSPSDMARNSETLLKNLSATQHLVASHVVSGGGGRASCKSQVIATHALPNALGDSLWTVGGHYYMELIQSDRGWRIAKLRLRVLWSTGNREIMRLARKASS